MTTTKDILSKARAELTHVPSTGRHMYIRERVCNTRQSLTYLLKQSKYTSPLYLNGTSTDESLDLFISLLADHVKDSPYVTNGKPRLFEIFRIMLPYNYPESRYNSPAHELMDTYFRGEEGILPYFFAITKKKGVTYLQLIICDRYYYPEGKVFDNAAKSDFYRNPVNGHRCSKDTPDAVLCWKKGTVLSQTFGYFSTVQLSLGFRSPSQHVKLNKDMKDICRKHFDRYSGSSHNSAYFGRINLDDLGSKTKHFCRAYNCMMQAMEAKCTEVLEALEGAGFEDDIPRFKQFIMNWRTKVLAPDVALKFVKKSYNCHICFRYPLPLNSLVRKTRFIMDSFNCALEKLVSGIWKSGTYSLFA